MNTSLFSFHANRAIILTASLVTSLLLVQCRHLGKKAPLLSASNKETSHNKTPPIKVPTLATPAGPPLGFWSEESSGLYVSIHSSELNDNTTDTAIGEFWLSVGGPPNRRMNADDAFFPAKRTLAKNSLTMTGVFNWDRSESEVLLRVDWSEKQIELTILKHSGAKRYDEKRYILKKRPDLNP